MLWVHENLRPLAARRPKLPPAPTNLSGGQFQDPASSATASGGGNTPPCSQADLAQGISDWTGTSPGLRSLSECSALLRRPCVSSWLPWRLSVKESACNVGDTSLIPGWEGTLEEEMAVHSNILAWETPRTEEPGRLQSMGLQRVGYGCVTEHALMYAQLKVCSGLFYLWQDTDPCWNLPDFFCGR